ncbi:YncE family protein [Mesorhizobium sp. WSM4976]|uniref:YncE family protein n=1 Tax=Mesorhizobium sp. WSM4976 TaxID=3038549 RepID=UPI00241693ED|nr:YncE family protein [Mesorhizobium sp. WSM4976]MDG4897744.1 YncE family protein [Mesorhizobium sp. WSM4976]
MRTAIIAFAMAAMIQAAMDVCQAADAPLIQVQSIPLENVRGRIDHMAVDVAGNRLFVAELGNDSVDIVDLKSGKVTGRISNLKEPQGIAYVSDGDLIVVANAGDGSVQFFRAADLSLLGAVALGDDADNVQIDPVNGRVLVGFGSGGLAAIGPTNRALIGEMKLAGHPEGFDIDPKTNRAFVNVPDEHQVAVLDLRSGSQVSSWKFAGLNGNFPMALVGSGGPIAVVFRSPPKLVQIDPATGVVTQSVDTCGDADNVFFDGKRNRFYVSCGDGAVDVIGRDADGLRAIGRVETSSGARTSLFVPELDRLFVAARAGWFESQAAILVFRPSR